MKVKNLIKHLSKLNQEAEILLSSDSEGNSYSILESYDDIEGFKYKIQDGEIDLVREGDIDDFFTEREYNKCRDCIVLYPH